MSIMCDLCLQMITARLIATSDLSQGVPDLSPYIIHLLYIYLVLQAVIGHYRIYTTNSILHTGRREDDRPTNNRH